MPKKIDLYIIKTFLGPFFFIFSILFFIFMVNIVWIQMFNLGGKGLTTWTLAKFFYYLSVGIIKMVLPLTILLASIMTFGGFGERYELAAMKSAGISLLRIMRPLLFTNIFFASILFLFSNYIIPDFQKKAKNMIYNIRTTKPALNFTPGQFITSLPETSIRFDELYGENDNLMKEVFIHKTAGAYEDQRTIIAKKGEIISEPGSNYLKFTLYDGFIFEDNLAKPNFNDRLRQENQSIKFDTLVSYFDISELLDKAIESEKITNDYEFQTYHQLNSTIHKLTENNEKNLKTISEDLVRQSSNYLLEPTKKSEESKITEPFSIDTLKQEKKLDILSNAYSKIEGLEMSKKSQNESILYMAKSYAKVVMYQQQIIAYSIMCFIFFLIGASLGSIVRKGGFGLPVIFAIIIFVIFFVINLSAENVAWKGKLNPYLAAWLPNIIFFPFSIWITYKALTDSQIFDIEKYKSLIKPFTKRFLKNKEHERYQ